MGLLWSKGPRGCGASVLDLLGSVLLVSLRFAGHQRKRDELKRTECHFVRTVPYETVTQHNDESQTGLG